jgi:hypothetical protein
VKNENEELNKKFKMLSFKNKWEKTFKILKMDSTANEYLEKYIKFYIKYRTPITHPKSRYFDAENFNFPTIFQGIRNGYCALEYFYKRLGRFEEEHSWNNFCLQTQLPLVYNG